MNLPHTLRHHSAVWEVLEKKFGDHKYIHTHRGIMINDVCMCTVIGVQVYAILFYMFYTVDLVRLKRDTVLVAGFYVYAVKVLHQI